jgi:hypothetical protein
LRLFAAPVVLFAAALLCYLLPSRMAGRARLVAAIAAVLAGGLLLSEAPLVLPSSRVERDLGEFAPGVHLVARADPATLAIALLATILALAAMLERRRQPLERSALLLCLAGTYVAALAGNAVLLFGGVEIANVGALLLAAGGAPRLRLRARIAFTLQHASSLGLLVAAVALQASLQTSDFTAVPADAMDWWIAGPWAFTGVVRLLAPAALPDRAGRLASAAWLPVGAVPCGLLVLLRLAQVAGAQMPAGISVMLIAAGLGAATWAAVRAARHWRTPARAGRALALVVAGEAIVMAGVGTPAAISAMAALGLALLLGIAAAPAWGAGGDEGSGRTAVWARATALAVMGGLPLGFGTTAVLLASGSVAAGGLPHSIVAVFTAGTAVVAAAAGALAARAVLVGAPPRGRTRGARSDAALPLGVSLVGAVLPGLAQTVFVQPVASVAGAAFSSVDIATARVPGSGWPGGYLAVAALVALAAAGSAAALEGRRWPAPEMPPAAQPPTTLAAAGALPGRIALPRTVRQTTRGLAGIDAWLVEQPGLALVVAGAIACLFIFR